MPTSIRSCKDILPGEIYEDSEFHPCICIGVDDHGVFGISLVDGSYPRAVDFGPTGLRKLSVAEAWEWRKGGPADFELSDLKRWWRSPD